MKKDDVPVLLRRAMPERAHPPAVRPPPLRQHHISAIDRPHPPHHATPPRQSRRRATIAVAADYSYVHSEGDDSE